MPKTTTSFDVFSRSKPTEKTPPVAVGGTIRRRVLARRDALAPARVPAPPPDAVPVADLPAHVENYLVDSRMLRQSAATVANKRVRLAGLLWFARDRGFDSLGVSELKRFFLYLSEGHSEESGRWGNKTCGSNGSKTRQLSPGTVKTYHLTVRAFFNWLVGEDKLASSPMARIAAPIHRPDPVQPFDAGQVSALYAAARRTAYPDRDAAIVLLLLNTGIRASELCSLVWADVNLDGGLVTIREGKGGKSRQVPLSGGVSKALHSYHAALKNPPETDAVFVAERGRDNGSPLTRSGLTQLVGRIAASAGVSGVRCSPHTFRHTFAVTYLRSKDRGGYGGNVFELKRILGHETLAMTNRYVALADADLTGKHREFDLLKVVRGVKRL